MNKPDLYRKRRYQINSAVIESAGVDSFICFERFNLNCDVYIKILLFQENFRQLRTDYNSSR